ncbi:MAG: hypothetical protein U0R52_00665 [Solirubrobacterales bacterium]
MAPIGNPLRSEAEAFRWVVAIGAAAGSVIALALLVSPALGAVWGLILVLCAGVMGFRALRSWWRRDPGPNGG